MLAAPIRETWNLGLQIRRPGPFGPAVVSKPCPLYRPTNFDASLLWGLGVSAGSHAVPVRGKYIVIENSFLGTQTPTPNNCYFTYLKPPFHKKQFKVLELIHAPEPLTHGDPRLLGQMAFVPESPGLQFPISSFWKALKGSLQNSTSIPIGVLRVGGSNHWMTLACVSLELNDIEFFGCEKPNALA